MTLSIFAAGNDNLNDAMMTAQGRIFAIGQAG
jgi:hypothetical protein